MLEEIIDNALAEDIGEGDHSTMACVPENARGKARLLVKEPGILAGVELAEMIFKRFDSNLKISENLIKFYIPNKNKKLLVELNLKETCEN